MGTLVKYALWTGRGQAVNVLRNILMKIGLHADYAQRWPGFTTIPVTGLDVDFRFPPHYSEGNEPVPIRQHHIS